VTAPPLEDLLRELAPPVLGAVTRHFGHFDVAEDATQEALIAAAAQWPASGVPDNPKAWLIRVASRKLTDMLRSDEARARREAAFEPPPPTADSASDDSLVLLMMCCHPSLTPAAQIALTLRAVGGLSTKQIARAFLTGEETMTRRLTRAKQAIRDSGVPFALPAADERAGRLAAVRHVLYLIFTEGYAAARADLATEAIRLHASLPEDPETAGLHHDFPGVQVAADAVLDPSNPRQQQWNSQLPPSLPPGGAVQLKGAQRFVQEVQHSPAIGADRHVGVSRGEIRHFPLIDDGHATGECARELDIHVCRN